jgi:hypothetical protein
MPEQLFERSRSTHAFWLTMHARDLAILPILFCGLKHCCVAFHVPLLAVLYWLLAGRSPPDGCSV